MTIAIKIGSIAVDSVTGVASYNASPSNSNYDTIEDQEDVNYQVPAGKILIISEIVMKNDTAGGRFRVGYGDTAVDNSASPPTNLVQMSQIFVQEVAGRTYEYEVFYKVPATKYPCISSTSGACSTNIKALLIDE